MAAKQKESYYFSHDCGSSRDTKIIKLRRKYGWEGYGVFWVIIEIIRETSEYEVEIDAVDDLLFEFKIKREIFDYLFECNLLQKDNSCFWSDSLKKRMELRERRVEINRQNGKKGGRPKKDDKDKEENQKLEIECDSNKAEYFQEENLKENAEIDKSINEFAKKSFSDFGIKPQDIQNALGQPTKAITEKERPLILALLSEGCIPDDFTQALQTTINEGKPVRNVKYLENRIRAAKDLRLKKPEPKYHDDLQWLHDLAKQGKSYGPADILKNQ